jgi:hypothetical protein
MENQKIQQLIRLASIADKNGDYKIADKIFNKLAAAPPRVPRMRNFEEFVNWVRKAAGNLENLNRQVDELVALKLAYENHRFPLIKTWNQADIDRHYKEFVTARDGIDELKSKLLLAKLNNPGDVPGLESQIQFDEDIIKDYGDLFGKLTSKPPSYNGIDVKLLNIQDEIKKIEPSMKELPKNDPNRIAIELLSARFEKMNLDAVSNAEKTVGNVFPTAPTAPTVTPASIEKTKVKKSKPFWGLFGETTTTTTTVSQQIQTTNKLFNIFKNPYNINLGSLKDTLKKYTEQKSLLENLPDFPTEAIGKGFQSFRGKPNEAFPILRDALKDIIDMYDFKFLEQFNKEVKLLKEIRVESRKTDSTLRPFDHLSNRKDFEEAANAAFTKLNSQDPTARIVIGLIGQLKTFIANEAAKVKAISPNSSDDLIASAILRNNKNLLRDTGLSRDNILTIVSEGDNFSIEDFLDFKPGSIKNLENPKVILYKGLLLSAAKGGVVTYLSSSIVNSLAPTVIPTATQAVKKTVIDPISDVVTFKKLRDKKKIDNERKEIDNYRRQLLDDFNKRK